MPRKIAIQEAHERVRELFAAVDKENKLTPQQKDTLELLREGLHEMDHSGTVQSGSIIARLIRDSRIRNKARAASAKYPKLRKKQIDETIARRKTERMIETILSSGRMGGYIPLANAWGEALAGKKVAPDSRAAQLVTLLAGDKPLSRRVEEVLPNRKRIGWKWRKALTTSLEELVNDVLNGKANSRTVEMVERTLNRQEQAPTQRDEELQKYIQQNKLERKLRKAILRFRHEQFRLRKMATKRITISPRPATRPTPQRQRGTRRTAYA